MNDDPRDRELEHAYREASRETPPDDLDARILAAAHRAMDARPGDAVRRPSWIDRFRLPLAVAATALIAVTLSLMVEDGTRREPEPDAPVAAPHDDTWGSRSAPAAPAPASAPAEARRAAPRAAQSAAGNAATVPSGPAAPAPAHGPITAPAATPPPAGASRERAAQERPARLTRDEAATAAAPRAPEPWLEEIRRLRAEGRFAEADESLAAFRRAWPDYPLPPDLARP